MEQTILVVEDDDMIRNLIKIYLEKNGYEVIEAGDGEHAKQQFLLHHPCLIILDLMLPKLSGEEFCSWIRNDLNNSDVSIIMLSAKAQIEDKVNGLRIGADNYVTKPFDPDELVAHVEALYVEQDNFVKK